MYRMLCIVYCWEFWPGLSQKQSLACAFTLKDWPNNVVARFPQWWLIINEFIQGKDNLPGPTALHRDMFLYFNFQTDKLPVSAFNTYTIPADKLKHLLPDQQTHRWTSGHMCLPVTKETRGIKLIWKVSLYIFLNGVLWRGRMFDMLH